MPKLLVVDDEKDVCEFVKNFLEDRGYEVMTALNGDDALAIAKKERPALVLLDIKMEGMDGLAALKHLKKMNRNQKVVMVTALEDRDKMDEASRLGAAEYITKPLALDHLEAVVEKMLRE
jgi:two-component system, response regulator, stage 0 sporulation protein F